MELLVVIAIIALLLAILTPSLRRVKDLAMSASCLARTHSLSLGYANWLANNKGKALGYSHTQNTMYWDWPDELAPFVQGTDITFCPKVTQNTGSQLVVGADCLMGGQNYAWRHKPPNAVRTYRGSFGLNEWLLCYETDTWATWQDPGRTMYFKTFASVVQPSQTPLLGDACWYGGWPKDVDQLPTSTAKAYGQPATTLEWPWSGSANNLERWCVDRHNTMVNMALADGGSRPVRLSDLWGLKWNMTFNTNLVRPAYP